MTTNTKPVESNTATARISATIDLTERAVAGDAFRVRAIRKPRVAKHEPRLSDGEAHPVTVTRIYEPWHEVALTDECESGCKVLERTVGRKVERLTVHSRVYGCRHPDAR